MNHWAFRLLRVMQVEACVLVTVGPVKGSAPRSPGTRMLVTRERCRGSIGGGNLEFTAIRRAREMLERAPASGFEVQMFGLGPALNQCCGGSVQVLFEIYEGEPSGWLIDYVNCLEQGHDGVLITRFSDQNCVKLILDENNAGAAQVPDHIATAAKELYANPVGMTAIEDQEIFWLEPVQQNNPQLYLFGAGHVGKALVTALEPLPFNITWIDSREYEFPGDIPHTLTRRVSSDPLQEVARAQAGTIYVVMTHSHELDEDLCHAILQRSDFAWLGLIGSTTKRRRFVSRLAKRGISQELLDRLVCPIGFSGVKGKQPATIAVAVAAQLLCEFSGER